MRDKNNACKGKENKVRVTRMVIIVIIVFAICWVPLQVIFKAQTYLSLNFTLKIESFQVGYNFFANSQIGHFWTKLIEKCYHGVQYQWRIWICRSNSKKIK